MQNRLKAQVILVALTALLKLPLGAAPPAPAVATSSAGNVIRVVFEHPRTESEARHFLADLVCAAKTSAQLKRFLVRPSVVIPLALLLVVATMLVAPLLTKRSREVTMNHVLVALSAFLTISGFALAAYQWQASIKQGAIKNYESEIATENLAEQPTSVRDMVKELYPSGTSDDEYAKAHYVYLQLDNLEYALERYVNGLSSAYTTSRAVMTFAARCQSEQFRARACVQVVAASYSPVVVRVVKRLIGHFPGAKPC